MNWKFYEIVFGRSVLRQIIASGHVAVINPAAPEFEVRPFLRPPRRLVRTAWTALWQFQIVRCDNKNCFSTGDGKSGSVRESLSPLYRVIFPRNAKMSITREDCSITEFCPRYFLPKILYSNLCFPSWKRTIVRWDRRSFIDHRKK